MVSIALPPVLSPTMDTIAYPNVIVALNTVTMNMDVESHEVSLFVCLGFFANKFITHCFKILRFAIKFIEV